MSNIFQTLELEAFRNGIQARTAESREWFRKKAAQLRGINRSQLMQEKAIDIKNRGLVGNMYMFYYDPKHKATLPYYDKFPLIVMVKRAPGGFIGLNLHYLPPPLRAKMLDGLMDNVSDKRFDDNTKFRINYAMLQRSSKLRYFKPCYKHYLTEHVKSRFAEVQAPEWEIAAFLPTAQWAKSTAANVYKDSRNMI